MTIEHVKVIAGDSWSRIATRLCPPKATASQRSTFAYALATSSQKKLSDTIYPGEVLHYDTADLPVVAVPVPPARTPKMVPFAASSPFNQPLPSSPMWRTEPILQTMGNAAAGDADDLAGQPRHLYGGDSQVFISHGFASDPVWTITMPEFGNDDPRFNRHWAAGTWKLRCPAAGPVAGGNVDAIVCIVDETTGEYIELGNAPCYTIDVQNKTIIGRDGAWHAHGNVDTGTGVGGLLSAGSNSAGVRAANFSWMAGAITGYDVDQVMTGKKTDFGHALCVMLTTATMSTWGVSPPATAPNNGPNHGPINNGARLGIPANVNPPAEMDRDPLNMALWNTLKKYGMFVGDFTGGPWPIVQFDGSTAPIADLMKMWVWWDYPNSAGVHGFAALRVMEV